MVVFVEKNIGTLPRLPNTCCPVKALLGQVFGRLEADIMTEPWKWKKMDVEPKIRGFCPPKWMVKIMENPIKIGFGGKHPYFWKHPYLPTN